MRPLLFLPPLRLLPCVKDFSGTCVLKSLRNGSRVICRTPGLVGLYCLMAILRDCYRFAFLEIYVGFPSRSRGASRPRAYVAALFRMDGYDMHLARRDTVKGTHRIPYLGFCSPPRYVKGIHTLCLARRCFLGDTRILENMGEATAYARRHGHSRGGSDRF